MAKSFTEFSLTTPVISLSLVAGGTLDPNTTYHYKVMAHSHNRSDNQDYYQSANSIGSITTTSTDLTVKITINQVANAYGYTIWRCKDITGTNPWNDRSKTSVLNIPGILQPTTVVDSGGATTIFDDNGASDYNQPTHLYVYVLEFALPRGDFNSTLGDIITMEDLKNNFAWITRPNTNIDFPKQYNVAGSLRIIGANTIWLIKNEDVVFWGQVRVISGAVGATININELTGTTFKSSKSVSKLTFRWYTHVGFAMRLDWAVTNIYNAIIAADPLNIVGVTTSFNFYPWIRLGGQRNSDIRDVILKGFVEFSFKPASGYIMTLRNVKCGESRSGLRMGGAGTLDAEDVSVDGINSGFVADNTNLNERKITGLTIRRSNADVSLLRFNMKTKLLLLDPVFPNGAINDWNDKRVQWFSFSKTTTEWKDEHVKHNYSYDKTILDKDGNSISGVTVDITDGKGVAYPQLTSDANGKVSVTDGLNLWKYIPNGNFNHVFTYDDGTATFTDVSALNTFDLFPDDAAVNDAIYFAVDDLWTGINLYAGTAFAAASQTFVWEYWNGSAWTAIPTTGRDFLRWWHTTTNPPSGNVWSSGQTNFVVGYHHIQWYRSFYGTTHQPQPVTVNDITSRFVRVRISAVNTPAEGGASAAFPTVYSYTKPYAGIFEIGNMNYVAIGIKEVNNPFTAIYRKKGLETYKEKFNISEAIKAPLRMRHSPTPGRDEMGDRIR